MNNRTRPLVTRTAVMSVVLLLALSITTMAFAASAFHITTVDSTRGVGEYSSLALNSSGSPVISYYDFKYDY